MASNPFFSGRIPQSLFDAVEEYRQENNISKTNVLIKALSAYVNLPLEIRAIQTEGNDFRFKSLENRVAHLEELLAAQQTELPEANGQMSLDDIQVDNIIDNGKRSTPTVNDDVIDNASENNSNEADITTDNKADNEKKAPDGVFIGTMKTEEVPKLPGLEDQDPKKIKSKLNNTKSTKFQIARIGSYTIVFSKPTETPAGKGQKLLWDVYEDNPSEASPLVINSDNNYDN